MASDEWSDPINVQKNKNNCSPHRLPPATCSREPAVFSRDARPREQIVGCGEREITNKNILITGASGGMGSALAQAFAAPNSTLVLLGRNEKKLLQTQKQCAEKGAQCHIVLADVCDEQYEKEIEALAKELDFDLVIANAGQNLLETFAEINEASSQKVSELMRVNFEGQIKTVFPLLAGLSRKKGRIAIIASFAAFRGLCQDPAYCASKAALSAFFEGCRATWNEQNIGVSLVYPGFVQTAMSDKLTGQKPFCISSQKAARIIKKGIERKKYRIIFPLRLRLLFNMQKLLPAKLVDRILLLD